MLVNHSAHFGRSLFKDTEGQGSLPKRSWSIGLLTRDETIAETSFKLLPRPRYIGGRGIVFDRFLCLFVCLFVYIFVSLLERLRENGWTDLHEIFREGVDDHGTTW